MSFWRRLFGPRRGFVLALGGGGGRGLAHLGVLEVLEREGLRPRAIVGTSIGALFGAMYALDPDAARVRRRVESFLRSDAFENLHLPHLVEGEVEDDTWLSRLAAAARQSALYARAATGRAVADSEALQGVVDTLCGRQRFEDAVIPFHVTAVTFPGGECRIFSRGDLRRAVAASMAIPGIFEPIEVDGQRYADGGLASEIPVREARAAGRVGDVVVAVNVGARPDPNAEPAHVIGMLDWAVRVKSLYLRRYVKQLADVLVEPLVGTTQWHDFSTPEREIERGREATSEILPLLRRRLGRSRAGGA